ncbi:immunoglobulin mu Fc receptor [Rhynchocyon petersi]
MNLWFWWLHFLPVFGAQKTLPEVTLKGEPGGSITFQCPLPKSYTRVYLCREITDSSVCTTVVSSGHYVKREYYGRVNLTLQQKDNIFLVEMTEMTESDSGVYACGVGKNTDRGKTQKITLSISVTRPAWKTQTPPDYNNPPDISVKNYPPTPRAPTLAAGKPPTLLPPTMASKTLVQEEQGRPQPASYNHQTRLHRHRAFDYGLSDSESPGFHILIPTVLGLMLLALLGMVVKRAIQRRKVLSRRVRRMARRMRAREASQRPRSLQRPRGLRQQRAQNIYSACPRRAPGAEAAGEPAGRQGAQRVLERREHNGWTVRPALCAAVPGRAGRCQAHACFARLPLGSCLECLGHALISVPSSCSGPAQSPLPGTEAPEPSAPPQLSPASPQVLEAPWFHASSLKTSYQYESCYHQLPAKTEDADSDDYINIAHLTHFHSDPPESGPLS